MLVSLLLLLPLAPVHPSMVYPGAPRKGKLPPEQVVSSLLKEGMARRGCAGRWSWQLGTKACGCPLPFFFPEGLATGKFTRVGLDRDGGSRRPHGGSGAGPRASWLPPSGLEPRLRDVPTGSPEWSGVTGCDAVSARALGLEKNLPGPRSPNTEPVDLSRQFS